MIALAAFIGYFVGVIVGGLFMLWVINRYIARCLRP